MEIPMRPIAYIHSDFKEKFGIPRQSGLASTKAEIVFVPPYNKPEAVRGLEGFSHIWLLWAFSENIKQDGSWSATVRPPRLGGNVRMGVFATRSPFRPNPIGMSCVELEGITMEKEGPVLHIVGADLMDKTPILDIKPYLLYSDSRPEATGGFVGETEFHLLKVKLPETLTATMSEEEQKALIEVLSQDPRPSYQTDSERVYGMTYRDMEIRFTVTGDVLTVIG
ncbi:MAG: tRNA (N6-threonylcarbamoyladenosine(37)-N6)-methyltransferase TrmO [Firmicutes bacterium]|nr:tRNA (N6-threonylcarbamoyladenosine(37)-N6)-methyltransferase TrmO [Bacillota bacterium]